jgi:rubredoxin
MIDANIVFSKISFQADIDYHTYPRSIYECPVCKNKLSFNMHDFDKYALNTKSIFPLEEQERIKKFAKKKDLKKSNSFIDFYCPQCNMPTRIYYLTWAGGRYTGGHELEFIVIDCLT